MCLNTRDFYLILNLESFKMPQRKVECNCQLSVHLCSLRALNIYLSTMAFVLTPFSMGATRFLFAHVDSFSEFNVADSTYYGNFFAYVALLCNALFVMDPFNHFFFLELA